MLHQMRHEFYSPHLHGNAMTTFLRYAYLLLLILGGGWILYQAIVIGDYQRKARGE